MTFNIKQDNLRISTRAGKLQGSVGAAWGRSIKHGDHTWSGSSSEQSGAVYPGVQIDRMTLLSVSPGS